MRMRLLSILLCVGLAACASTPRLGGADGQPMAVTEATELPAPTAQDLVQASQPYLIGPFDKLSVTVFGVPELSRDVQADATGNIQLPLLGTINATGQTPQQLSELITTQLRGRYVRDPQVTVNLTEANSQSFAIDGQVMAPGNYSVTGNLSLMRAVATAKGLSEYAKLDDVVVFRTVDGKSMAALYNLGAIRRGVYADPKIYANDIVVVGDSKSRRLFKDLLAVAPTLLTPIIILLQ